MASLVVKYTKSGIAHGLVNKVANSIQSDGFEHMNPKTKAFCIKEKAENAKIVKVRYVNSDPGEFLEMPYCAGGGEPIESWVFLDQQVYEVPLGLAKIVNGKQWIQRSTDDKTEDVGKNPHAYNLKDTGETIIGHKRKHQFFSANELF